MRLGELLAQDVPQDLLRKSGKDNMEEAFLYYASRQVEEQLEEKKVEKEEIQ
jgi:hypothetical protein